MWADMTEQLQPARWKGLPDDLSPCCLLVCLPPASVHFHAWRSRWRLLFVIELLNLDYLRCDGPTVSNMWTGLVCVFNRTPSLGCVVTRTECSSSRSGFYWFIYHWATVEDDPGLQTFWPVSVVIVTAERSSYISNTQTRKQLWTGRCVCVCASVLSMGTDEINGVQSGGLRPDHLLCRWSICERCSGCFWPFLSLRVWKKSEVTRRWQTHLRVWSLSMRRQEHLSGDNETVSPGESALSVTLSCLYHLYLQRAHANKSEWSRDELSVHQAELLKSVVSVSVDVIGPAVVERCSRIFSLE